MFTTRFLEAVFVAGITAGVTAVVTAKVLEVKVEYLKEQLVMMRAEVLAHGNRDGHLGTLAQLRAMEVRQDGLEKRLDLMTVQKRESAR